MTQIKNINPCVTVTQTEWNKLEVLEVMQIRLHKTCVRYTQNKLALFHLKSELKMCNSLNNIIMRTGHQ